MAEKRILKENGVDIIPITHETAVITEEGTTIVEKYATKEEVNTQIQEESSEINARVDAIDTKVGDLSTLETTDKSSVTNAINELFQRGNSVKQKLVDTLIAKDVEASTSETFESLLAKYKELEFTSNYPYTVEHGGVYDLPNMPITPEAPVATECNGKIYLVCGNLDYLCCYDPSANSWSTIKNIFAGKYYYSSLASCNNIVYRIGGYLGTSTSTLLTTLYAYDTTTSTVSSKTACSVGYARGRLENCGGKLYFMGGSAYSTSTAYKTNYCYDPSTNTWTSKTTMTAVRHTFTSFVADSKIVVLGGCNASGISQKTYYVYDSTSDSWSTGTAMSVAMHGFGAHRYVDDAGNIYYQALPGLYTSSSSSSQRTNIYKYDASSSAWSLRNLYPWNEYGGCYYAYCPCNGKLYIMGGTYLDSSWRKTMKVFIP